MKRFTKSMKILFDIMDLTLSRYIYTFNLPDPETPQWVFFDRGTPDAVSHLEFLKMEVPVYLKAAAGKFRYHHKVFLTPPWPEIFHGDAERTHGLAESIAAYETAVKTYTAYGYQVITVPKDNVQNRAKFILQMLEADQR